LGAAHSRSRIDHVSRGALLALTAAALVGLPASVPEGLATPADIAPLGLHAITQDTTRQDTTQAGRREETGEEVRDVRRALEERRRGGIPSDSVPADSVVESGPPFPAPDSVMQALMQRPGYRPVVYRGDTLQFSTRDRSIHLRERAEIERAGERLYADSVVYDGATLFVTAYGKSKLINAKGEEVDSEVGPLFYHTERKIGTMLGGRTRWEIWNVIGNFTLEGSDTLWVREGTFTSCDLPEPHYHFASDRIKLIMGHIIVAWPVRLYFGEVPVFWFPFIAQDIRRGRHSGILTFGFGVNDIVRNSSGYNRHISNLGYYWAISDYMDAQLSLDWWSDTWTRLDGFYRYRWRQKFLNGRLGYSHFFLPNGGRELSLAWNHSQKFGERSDLRASVQYVSSQTFRRESEFNPERLVQQIRSDVGFTSRLNWGTLNLSGQRIQPLTEGEATTTSFPQFSLTLSPIVLTPARSPLEARWFNGLTWNGSTNFGRQLSSRPGQPDRSSLSARATSGLSLGSLRLNSSSSYTEQVIDQPDTLSADTTIVDSDTTISNVVIIGPQKRTGTLRWRTSVGYQQRLIGSTTVTPAVNFDGTLFRSNETDLDFVAAPTRISMSATLNTDLYAFFPGLGPLQRIRHKLSPAFSWSYSPATKPSERILELRDFRADSALEQHVLSMTLSQTFEAKLKPRESAAGDSAQADTVQAGRPPEAPKITLLAIRTTPFTYDLVRGRLTTNSVSNSITSDLLRGLSLRVDHELFTTRDGRREFDLFLRQLNLSFSLGGQTMGDLAGAPSAGIGRGRGIVPEAREFEEGEPEFAAEDEDKPRLAEEARGGPRPWSLSIDYSLVRTRPLPDQEPPPNRQSVRANLGFKPTENWTVRWRTQYDLEKGEFVDHALSLQRDLHRWSASFQFLKAANGNFMFDFRVHLNDLRDVKFDYRQENRRSGGR